MEKHLKDRPHKKVFKDKKTIDALREKAIKKVKAKLLPDEKIIKIVIIGSSVKYTFGEYDPPGFRGSLFSDFDFIIFVEDDYKIPNWLTREPSGKPFPNDEINLAYRNKKFIDNKYDIEIFFLKRNTFEKIDIQKQGELAGIPMSSKTEHKHIVVYER